MAQQTDVSKRLDGFNLMTRSNACFCKTKRRTSWMLKRSSL